MNAFFQLEDGTNISLDSIVFFQDFTQEKIEKHFYPFNSKEELPKHVVEIGFNGFCRYDGSGLMILYNMDAFRFMKLMKNRVALIK